MGVRGEGSQRGVQGSSECGTGTAEAADWLQAGMGAQIEAILTFYHFLPVCVAPFSASMSP